MGAKENVDPTRRHVLRTMRIFNRPARTLSVLCLCFATACASGAKPRLNYEGYSVVSERNPTVVDAIVTVRNTGSATAKIPVAVCPFQVAAFADPERQAQPLWKSSPDTCVTLLMLYPPILVAPGDFFDYRVRVNIPPEMTNRTLYLSMTVPGHRVPVGQVARR